MVGLSDKVAIQTLHLTKIYRSYCSAFRFFRSFRSSKKISGAVAVDHVNIAIRRGQLFGFLDPNGGQTSLIKMLCTILTPDYGTAIIKGFDIRKVELVLEP